jgi:hypothetical protein
MEKIRRGLPFPLRSALPSPDFRRLSAPGSWRWGEIHPMHNRMKKSLFASGNGP